MPAGTATFADARAALLRRRGELCRLAAQQTPGLVAPHIPVIAPPGGCPPAVPLEAVELRQGSAPAPDWEGLRDAARGLFAPRGPRLGYAEAVLAHEPGRRLWNGAVHRLVAARRPDHEDRARGDDGGPVPALVLEFATGEYFATIDTCEVLAHELAARPQDRRLRSLHPDPFDFRSRSTGLAVATLTIVTDPRGPRVFLIRRAPDVAVAPGMVHVVPAGEFQPTDDGEGALDLVGLIGRELQEELADVDERESSGEPLRALLESGDARAWTWGVFVDALTLKAELLCALVLGPEALASIAGSRITSGVEGTLLSGDGTGLPFDAETLGGFVEAEDTVPFAAATLSLALRDRERILPAGAGGR